MKQMSIPTEEFNKIVEKTPIPVVDVMVRRRFGARYKYLLGRRTRKPDEGKWWLIGGVVRRGESPAQAAVRKVREEAGLDVEILAVLDVYMHHYRNGYHGLDSYMQATLLLAEAVWGTLRRNLENSALIWVDINSLPEGTAEGCRKTFDILKGTVKINGGFLLPEGET